MSQLEKDIEAKLVQYAKKKGVLFVKIEKRRGWPDRLMLYNGRAAWMEVKRPGEKPEPLQEYIHGTLRTAGFDVAVVDNYAQGCQVLDQFALHSSDF